MVRAVPGRIGTVLAQKSLSANTRAGLTAIGDRSRGVGIAVKDKKIVLFTSKLEETKTIEEVDIPDSDIIHFRLMAQNGNQLNFAWSVDGENRNILNKDQPIDASYPQPWDRSVRVGVTVKGPVDGRAKFHYFKMNRDK